MLAAKRKSEKRPIIHDPSSTWQNLILMRLVVKDSRNNRAHACQAAFLKKMTAVDFDCHNCYVGEIWDRVVFVSPSATVSF
jgi:hypothetical protein